MKEYHILSLGAGVQSTTLYLLAMEGEIRCDMAIFADTQDEPQAVYKHLEWLKSLQKPTRLLPRLLWWLRTRLRSDRSRLKGGPPILIRTKGCLGDDLIREESHGKPFPYREHHRHRFASIPAFTDGGEGGMVRRMCSKEYKTEVVERAIRQGVVGLAKGQRVPKDTTIHQYIGISWDERARSVDVERRINRTSWIAHFPLIERQWTRADCRRYLKSRVPHEVPKSACVYCPFHDDRAWQRLKDTGGADWDRIIQIDTALRTPGNIVNRNLDQKLYLHRSCKPITEIDFVNQNQEVLGFMMECEGMCGV